MERRPSPTWVIMPNLVAPCQIVLIGNPAPPPHQKMEVVQPFNVTQGQRIWQGWIGYLDFLLVIHIHLSYSSTVSEKSGDIVYRKPQIFPINAPLMVLPSVSCSAVWI